MRLAFISASVGALLASAAAGQGSANAIAGNWRTDDARAVITIAPCSAGASTLCGRISRFLVPEPAGGARDTNNPDRALRSRSLMGIQVLSGLSFRDGAWRGRGYSPEEGRTFDVTVRPNGSHLNVRGCVAVFCRTVVWARTR